jgi:hypothetical protein
MSRFAVLVSAALALVACSKGGGDAKDAKRNGEAATDTVSVTGVVAAVEPDKVRVTTDDGRQIALKMSQTVSVTLAGGEAESAVITEGAPVRVSYRPKGSGGDLVTIDVEPQAAKARGETKGVPQDGPPANPQRASEGTSRR